MAEFETINRGGIHTKGVKAPMIAGLMKKEMQLI